LSPASGATTETSPTSFEDLSAPSLNVTEGNHSQGGHRIARFCTAAGSNAESRAALRVAVAWGYVQARDIEAGEARLDRIAAMLHGLGARRR
jgi:four helix bundle protein